MWCQDTSDPGWLFTNVGRTYTTTDVVRHTAYWGYYLFDECRKSMTDDTPGPRCKYETGLVNTYSVFTGPVQFSATSRSRKHKKTWLIINVTCS